MAAMLGSPEFWRAPGGPERQGWDGMRIWGLVVALLAMMGLAAAVSAQEQAWIQVEAHPTVGETVERAEAYAAVFADVSAYRTATGWHAIVLGPYEPAAAAGRLAELRRENMIPGDSYVVDGRGFGAQVWPVAGAAPVVAPPAEPTVEPAPEPEPQPMAIADETPAEARASEGLLLPEERIALQEALGWYGFYQGGLDGAFGKGTRASMAAWQEANGYEPTGILTTLQRNTLTANFRADQAEFGFQSVTEAEAGIEITLPLSLVAFQGYEPPFVRFTEKDGSGLQVMLISEPGGTEALHGLYDILQTLEVVPATGERGRTDASFDISARSDSVESYAHAETRDGMVKGYLVVWKPADAGRMERILPVLKSSFRMVGGKALDPGLVPMEDAARAGMLAGLDVRRPVLSRSGFYVDGTGAVLTTAEAVAQCGHVTLDHDTEAEITRVDSASGLALLRPLVPVAPRAVAGFATVAPRPGTELAIAGYSYEDKLPAPVLTFGLFEEAQGLAGETGIARISAPVLAGDAGGPVLDPTGAVVGMLLPAGGPQGKVLPSGVSFIATAATIGTLLTGAGISPVSATGLTPASPDALNNAGLGMTVLVSCWE